MPRKNPETRRAWERAQQKKARELAAKIAAMSPRRVLTVNPRRATHFADPETGQTRPMGRKEILQWS